MCTEQLLCVRDCVRESHTEVSPTPSLQDSRGSRDQISDTVPDPAYRSLIDSWVQMLRFTANKPSKVLHPCPCIKTIRSVWPKSYFSKGWSYRCPSSPQGNHFFWLIKVPFIQSHSSMYLPVQHCLDCVTCSFMCVVRRWTTLNSLCPSFLPRVYHSVVYITVF